MMLRYGITIRPFLTRICQVHTSTLLNLLTQLLHATVSPLSLVLFFRVCSVCFLCVLLVTVCLLLPLYFFTATHPHHYSRTVATLCAHAPDRMHSD